MKKRLASLFMVVVLLLSFSNNVFACDEEQTNTYVRQILFGYQADSRASDENVKMLMAALYLCSEQADNQGQDKIDYLKSHKVSGIPALKKLNISNYQLFECSHSYWEYEYPAAKSIRANRQKVLRNTVNKVFGFDFFDYLFGGSTEKCDSFAAMLYYSHILADYLPDDSSDTEVMVNDQLIPSYSGKPYIEINNNKPEFSSVDISRVEAYPFVHYSPLEGDKRGTVLALVGPETLAAPSDKNLPDPPGWIQNKYDCISGNQEADLYNRSHIFAHSLGGEDEKYNLVTGTNYMNQRGMKPFEDKVRNYVNEFGNHVLYRVTPIYKESSNKVCSGVQMEAYSIEDSGQGVCFNVYCYNVQPGIKINYATGDNWKTDTISDSNCAIPFAVSNPSKDNPDLIYAMNEQFEILFKDQKTSDLYIQMMNDINSIANEARAIVNSNDNSANKYINLKQCQYMYFDRLAYYVPQLLAKEEFFSKAFK